MQKATLAKAGVGGAVALALGLGAFSPAAYADVQPRSTDAVAIGSDTVQFIGDFGADGDTGGDLGYNAVNTSHRLFSFDATSDASGRTGYVNGTSTALASSVVLRAGTKPIVRPNGSGAGITALLADTTHQIDFVRSSRLPKQSEQTSAAAVAFGGIHVFQIATDGLAIAAATTTNSPAGLSAAELANIYNGTYKKWSEVPGYSGSHGSDGIVPVIPQTGSGTRNDFIADIKTQTGIDLTNTLASNVKVAEEHDPTGITGVATGTDVNGNPVSAADAISPFSVGRFNLINSAYFGTTPAPNTIQLETGTAPDASAAYFLQRHLYLLARQSDVTSTTPFQTGGSANLVNTLFGKASSWFGKAANAPLFNAAGGNPAATNPNLVGVSQAWQDLSFAFSG
ncbi:periplasmic binding family protein [Jatrophihabitans sp. GAS493]|uniref:PstS family phosphate ABC transporter substrate-binding protein n=1 Tax=Jatrophihabitans sp. GAS493 TaxID=1907575 RepID=UPI000BB8AAF1|nr:substrate-binding domain-containing protein [Jatrophihabitans sp. GAS493]SOD72295.1 periplasmic binding family protein [Jatrophihabitans sp. GAS493]